MARIAGINIPMNKHVWIGLTQIYGVGKARARQWILAPPQPKDPRRHRVDVDRDAQVREGCLEEEARCVVRANDETDAPLREGKGAGGDERPNAGAGSQRFPVDPQARQCRVGVPHDCQRPPPGQSRPGCEAAERGERSQHAEPEENWANHGLFQDGLNAPGKVSVIHKALTKLRIRMGFSLSVIPR